MQIRLATEKDRAAWDSYIDRFPDIPYLNYYVWKEVLERNYKVKPLFFMALNINNEICGVCSTYVIRDIGNKRYLYSLKFGLLVTNANIQNKMLIHLKTFCEKNNIVFCSVTSGYEKVTSGFKETTKTTLILKFSDTEEEAWKGLRDKTRNMIRKANRSGLIAERGFHNLKDFYNIYLRNMLYKGVPIHSYGFLLGLSEEMRGRSELIIAKRQDRILAGILILYSKAIAIYPFQSALMDSRKYAPNQFLIWEAMKSCIKNNIYMLDMGEASKGGDGYQFKKNYGGKPTDVYYYNPLQLMKVQELKKDSLSKNNKMLTKHSPFSMLSKIILKYSPFWLKKKIGLWLKTKTRII